MPKAKFEVVDERPGVLERKSELRVALEKTLETGKSIRCTPEEGETIKSLQSWFASRRAAFKVKGLVLNYRTTAEKTAVVAWVEKLEVSGAEATVTV